MILRLPKSNDSLIYKSGLKMNLHKVIENDIIYSWDIPSFGGPIIMPTASFYEVLKMGWRFFNDS